MLHTIKFGTLLSNGILSDDFTNSLNNNKDTKFARFLRLSVCLPISWLVLLIFNT
jgi:hypothetical protein